MDILGSILSLLLTILGILWSIIWWFLSFFIMPLLVLAILAALALRYAYRTPIFKPYVERLFASLGGTGRLWAKRLVYSITVLPIRVVLRFIGFSILHAWVNLWWRPKWSPWERAIKPPKEKDQRA